MANYIEKAMLVAILAVCVFIGFWTERVWTGVLHNGWVWLLSAIVPCALYLMAYKYFWLFQRLRKEKEQKERGRLLSAMCLSERFRGLGSLDNVTAGCFSDIMMRRTAADELIQEIRSEFVKRFTGSSKAFRNSTIVEIHEFQIEAWDRLYGFWQISRSASPISVRQPRVLCEIKEKLSATLTLLVYSWTYHRTEWDCAMNPNFNKRRNQLRELI
jgi:hypothetical protein